MGIPGENPRRLLRQRVPHPGQPHEALTLSGTTLRCTWAVGWRHRGRQRRPDAARTALRLGAEDVRVVCRRSPRRCPPAEEVDHARAEGIVFDFGRPGHDPRGREAPRHGMRNVQMCLGEPGADGRRVLLSSEGTETDVEVDMVIMALGTRPNPLVPSPGAMGSSAPAMASWRPTRRPGAPALRGSGPGAISPTGSATVISAMGAGKRAAADIDASCGPLTRPGSLPHQTVTTEADLGGRMPNQAPEQPVALVR